MRVCVCAESKLRAAWKAISVFQFVQPRLVILQHLPICSFSAVPLGGGTAWVPCPGSPRAVSPRFRRGRCRLGRAAFVSIDFSLSRSALETAGGGSSRAARALSLSLAGFHPSAACHTTKAAAPAKQLQLFA